MRVLPDTSIWVDYLRQGTRRVDRVALDGLLDQRRVVVCGPILAELMAGAGDDSRDELWTALASLPWGELDREAWRKAGEVAARLRGTGKTVPLTDVVIAIACIATGAALWTNDSDFERVASVLPELEFFRPGR